MDNTGTRLQTKTKNRKKNLFSIETMKNIACEKSKTNINSAHILVITATIAIIVLLQVLYVHATTDYSASVNEYYTEINGNKVFVTDVDSNKYLFLPSEADTTNIQLQSIKQGHVVYFLEQGSTSPVLDLGDILAGNSYITSVQIINENGIEEESFSLTIMQGSGIGSLYFNSSDPVQYGRIWIDRLKENRSSGTAIVTEPDGTILNPEAKKQVVEDLHGRGHSSWEDSKKSYQIKFDKKVSLIDGAAEAKKWILLAQYKDPLRMNDKIMKDIANEVSDRFSSREIWINFYYDGEYRGVYLLSEKIEVKTGRIDITDMEEYYKSQDEGYGENPSLNVALNDYYMPFQYQSGLAEPEKYGGYLLEMNKLTWDENNGFNVIRGSSPLGINIKSPEFGSYKSVKYISEYFREFYDAVCESSHSGKNPKTGLYYYDYCDLDSLVDAYLIQCVSSEIDSFSRSQFFYKDVDAKLIAGPVWDMDLSFGTGWDRQEDPEKDFLADRGFTRDLIRIPDFRRKVRERYLDVYSEILARLAGSDDIDGSFSNYYSMISKSLAMDNVIWPEKYKCGSGSMQWSNSDSLETVLAYRIDWLTKHKDFLDEYFSNMTVDESNTHIFGDAVFASETAHNRECLLHPGEIITEDHCWDSGVLTVPASYGVMGVRTYTCMLCGAERTEATSDTGNNTSDPGGSTSGGSGGGSSSSGGNTDSSTGNPEQEVEKGAETVSQLISGIDVDNPDETAVIEARRAYDDLSNDEKSLLASEEVGKLEAAEKRLQELKGLAETEAKKETGAESAVSAGIVTVTSKENKTVAFTAADSTKKSIVVPATVKISGEIFKVTEIKTGAFRQSAATTVTISKNIKQIGEKAFDRSKVTKLIVMTTNLTKKTVKDSLKGSKVRTVQVKVGNKSLNKKYLKRYKKILTKAIAGRKVTIK